jgi:hypothetical protein
MYSKILLHFHPIKAMVGTCAPFLNVFDGFLTKYHFDWIHVLGVFGIVPVVPSDSLDAMMG